MARVGPEGMVQVEEYLNNQLAMPIPTGSRGHDNRPGSLPTAARQDPVLGSRHEMQSMSADGRDWVACNLPGVSSMAHASHGAAHAGRDHKLLQHLQAAEQGMPAAGSMAMLPQGPQGPHSSGPFSIHQRAAGTGGAAGQEPGPFPLPGASLSHVIHPHHPHHHARHGGGGGARSVPHSPKPRPRMYESRYTKLMGKERIAGKAETAAAEAMAANQARITNLLGAAQTYMLFDRLGSWEVLTAAVDAMYTQLMEHEQTRPFFENIERSRTMNHITAFIVSALSGRLVHSPLDVWQKHRHMLQRGPPKPPSPPRSAQPHVPLGAAKSAYLSVPGCTGAALPSRAASQFMSWEEMEQLNHSAPLPGSRSHLHAGGAGGMAPAMGCGLLHLAAKDGSGLGEERDEEAEALATMMGCGVTMRHCASGASGLSGISGEDEEEEGGRRLGARGPSPLRHASSSGLSGLGTASSTQAMQAQLLCSKDESKDSLLSSYAADSSEANVAALLAMGLQPDLSRGPSAEVEAQTLSGGYHSKGPCMSSVMATVLDQAVPGFTCVPESGSPAAGCCPVAAGAARATALHRAGEQPHHEPDRHVSFKVAQEGGAGRALHTGVCCDAAAACPRDLAAAAEPAGEIDEQAPADAPYPGSGEVAGEAAGMAGSCPVASPELLDLMVEMLCETLVSLGTQADVIASARTSMSAHRWMFTRGDLFCDPMNTTKQWTTSNKFAEGGYPHPLVSASCSFAGGPTSYMVPGPMGTASTLTGGDVLGNSVWIAQAGGSVAGSGYLSQVNGSAGGTEVQWSTESDGYAAGAQAQAMHLHFIV
mmetsp:Transcript_35420/g.89662  ORF Transcript_35420/g.89662 Transcript_35420/m.89662 type:complete len:819 (-) Transcript_35420:2130-4586(-)